MPSKREDRPMHRKRPWTPLDYALAPTAFWLTHVVRPIFDTLWPEPTKYKYRVADKTDAEKDERT